MTQTMFIHVWKYTDGTDLLMEQTVATTIEGSIEQYYQEDALSFEYQYTLHIVTGSILDFTRKMDIRDFLPKEKVGANDNERLTGHEMGICPGRV